MHHARDPVCVPCGDAKRKGLWRQVFLAVLVRGYKFTPLDINEAFTTWPVGGEPVAGLLMDIEKK